MVTGFTVTRWSWVLVMVGVLAAGCETTDDEDATDAPTTVDDMGAVGGTSTMGGSASTGGTATGGMAGTGGDDTSDMIEETSDDVTGGATADMSDTPDDMPPNPTGAIAEIHAGTDFTCALMSDQTVWCWGANTEGQLGDDTMVTERSIPAPVTGLTQVIDLELSDTISAHACAVLADNTAQCWGQNDDGQLGNDSTVNAFAPVNVSGLTNVAQIDPGRTHTCALLTDNTVQCWGRNAFDVFGTPGRIRESLVPVASEDVNTFLTGERVRDLVCGNRHNCGVLDDGRVFCWGASADGELGDGMPALGVSTPVFASGLMNIQQLAVGDQHSCAILSDDTLWCWGSNEEGQIGDGTFETRTTPAQVTSLSAVAHVDAGGGHTCAALQDGTVWCWGENPLDMHPSTTDASINAPLQVMGLSNIRQVSVGLYHSCALAQDDTIYCWGNNLDGQLGVPRGEDLDDAVNTVPWPTP